MRLNETLIVIPYRNRGDERRGRNLRLVLDHLNPLACVTVMNDGGSGQDQFNRSRSYNRGVVAAQYGGFKTIIFNEADMIVPHHQLEKAVRAAAEGPGLVIPFTERRELDDETTDLYSQTKTDPFLLEPERTFKDGFSIGAVNVVSMETMKEVGQWDETFSGSWYDDNAMFRAFTIATGDADWIKGPSVHLWHMPAFGGDHLTTEDVAATQRNKDRYENQYLKARSAHDIRTLTAGGTL
jgi:hypothetical protein